MTATSEPETKSPSRRALLAGALGGIGAWAAAAIGRASPVRGANGNTVHVGDQLVGTSVTRIANLTNENTAIWGDNTAGVGIVGTSSTSHGVLGISDSQTGVRGESTTGYGVHGHGTTNPGVVGDSTSNSGVIGASTSWYAVEGQSTHSYGVVGTSIDGGAMIGANNATDIAAITGRARGNSTGVVGLSGTDLPGAKPKTGVYGSAVQDEKSKGVWGESSAGHGIHGSSSTGWAGWFSGRVYTSTYHELSETSTPAAPATSRGRLFLRDNGAGKTELCVRFNTGAVQVLATQP